MQHKLMYDSQKQRHPALDAWVELQHFKDLVRLLVGLSLTVRYKRSLLGVTWALLNPLLHMLVLTVAFSTLFVDRLPRYPVYVMVGLMVFDFFRQTTTFAVNQLTWGTGLLGRVYLPAAVFPLSAVGTSVVHFGLTLLPLMAIMILLKNPFSWALLFLPVPLVLLSLLSLGFGLLLAALAISFNDLVNMWDVLLRAWYFLTPIMYPEAIIPVKVRWLLAANPLHHLLVCLRDPIYLGNFPDLHHVLVATIWSVSVALVGWWFFSLRRFEFALQA